MSGFDLDAAREARVEKLGERFFMYRGERFDLPEELPYTVVEPIGMLVENEANILALRATMVELLGPETHERFEAMRPSLPDLNDLVEYLFIEYGLGKPATNGAPGEIDPKSQPS